MQATKARGTKLGSPDPKKGAAIRSQVLQEKADRFAANILPIIHDLQAQGITGSRALSRPINARGIQMANQRQWYPTTVKNLLQRTNGEKMYHPTTDAIRRQICPDMPRLPYPTISRNR